MTKILLGIFFILHGLVHGIMLMPFPEMPGQGLAKFYTDFINPRLLKTLGLSERWVKLLAIIFSLVAMVGFIIVGIALLSSNFSTAFSTIVLISAVISVLLIIFYWHPYQVVGLILNVAILVLIPLLGHRLY